MSISALPIFFLLLFLLTLAATRFANTRGRHCLVQNFHVTLVTAFFFFPLEKFTERRSGNWMKPRLTEIFKNEWHGSLYPLQPEEFKTKCEGWRCALCLHNSLKMSIKKCLGHIKFVWHWYVEKYFLFCQPMHNIEKPDSSRVAGKWGEQLVKDFPQIIAPSVFNGGFLVARRRSTQTPSPPIESLLADCAPFVPDVETRNLRTEAISRFSDFFSKRKKISSIVVRTRTDVFAGMILAIFLQ